LEEHRGVDKGDKVVNDSINKYFTHITLLSDMPGSEGYHPKALAFCVEETVASDVNQRGIYMLTRRIGNESQFTQIPMAERGGVTLAHELMHMVIQPKRDGKTWDELEHLVADPNGNELMGLPAKERKNRQEETLVIGPETQREIDLAFNPALK
jgi:hypothetical protein